MISFLMSAKLRYFFKIYKIINNYLKIIIYIKCIKTQKIYYLFLAFNHQIKPNKLIKI